MRCFYLLLACVALVLPVAAGAQTTIDDFESGTTSGWRVQDVPYTAISLVSPGAGASANAIAIQEVAGSLGGHSAYAYAAREFATAANWTGYSTLELDAQINSGEWNGYSIRLYNDHESVWIHGIQSDSSVSGFRTLKFNLAGVARDKVTSFLIYVNRTSQNAGQAISLDNIRLTNNPVTFDPVRVIENFASGDISKWTPGGTSPNFQCSLTATPENAPSDTSAPANALSATLIGSGNSSLFRWRPAQAMDWTDYKTLEFDTKLATGTVTDGFSVRIYNMQLDARIKKFVPGVGAYATWQVDVSGIERDQINEVLFYLNRTLAYSTTASPARPLTLSIDNLRLTNNTVSSGPNVVYLDDFDDGDIANWDWIQKSGSVPNSTIQLTSNAQSAPWALDQQLVGGSAFTYARETLAYDGAQTQDWEDYKSLMFEAMIIPGPVTPNYPVGFTANVLNGGTYPTQAAGTDGPGGGNLWFYPSGYNTWETFSLDLAKIDVNPDTGIGRNVDVDQVSGIRWYINRALRSNYGMVDPYAYGEILRLDNIRISKEPAPPLDVSNPNVDDFEDGDIADWYYVQQSTDQQTGETLPGVSRELTSDAASGSKALVITCLNPPASTSAYTRKTMQANWSWYKTLEFDARVSDAKSGQGFTVRLRNPSGYAGFHEFYPDTDWKHFSVDISQDKVGSTTTDARGEVVGLLFYVNQITGYGVAQGGGQKLYLDNIKLTNKAVTTSFSTVGGLKNADTGTIVKLSGVVSAGSFANAVPDKNTPATLRTVFFVEDPDRSSAVPIVIGSAVTNVTDVPSGSKVDVTGILTAGPGLRYIYAQTISTPTPGFAIPDPIELLNKNAGAEKIGADAGLSDFYGVDTMGMLATVNGEILGVGTDGQGRTYMYMDDGSGVAADNGAVGLKVYDWTATTAVQGNVGKHVKVTGFVMTEGEMDGTAPTWKPIRSFWPKADLPNAIVIVD